MRKFVFGGSYASFVGLLDLYPAEVGYSLRKLRTAYTGSAIRVRRSSDNAEQDIGFVGVDLDTTSLLSFVGAGNGFITKWYNQGSTGTTNDGVQSSASNQPRIVNSGSLYTFNGVNYLFFNSASSNFLNSNYTEINNIYSCGVFRTLGNAQIYPLYRNDQFKLGQQSVANWGFRLASVECAVISLPPAYFPSTSTASPNTSYISQGYWNNVERKVKHRKNGTDHVDSATTGASLRSGTGSEAYDTFYITEIIISSSISWTNRTNIETNINTKYAIY